MAQFLPDLGAPVCGLEVGEPLSIDNPSLPDHSGTVKNVFLLSILILILQPISKLTNFKNGIANSMLPF